MPYCSSTQTVTIAIKTLKAGPAKTPANTNFKWICLKTEGDFIRTKV